MKTFEQLKFDDKEIYLNILNQVGKRKAKEYLKDKIYLEDFVSTFFALEMAGVVIGIFHEALRKRKKKPKRRKNRR